jgi:hypothetical protein
LACDESDLLPLYVPPELAQVESFVRHQASGNRRQMQLRLQWFSVYLNLVLTRLLQVRDSLNLSYGTSPELNKIIDEKLPGRPKFTRSEVVVNGEVFHLYSRDILECVRALWGDTDFAPYLFVVPERHYIDKDKTIRMYHNMHMHTGKWWWSTQVSTTSF